MQPHQPHSLLHLTIFCCFAIAAGCNTVKLSKEKPSLGPKSGYDEYTLAVHFIQPIFEILDCENVGIVQAGDSGEHMGQLFYARDRDRSRTLSQPEFIRAAHAELDSAIFSRIDSDGDGVLSDREYRSYVEHAIRIIDTSGDAEVTLEEAKLLPNDVQATPVFH